VRNVQIHSLQIVDSDTAELDLVDGQSRFLDGGALGKRTENFYQRSAQVSRPCRNRRP
jgi:hypothetical protein